MKAHQLPKLSIAEYIQQELTTQSKYEFHNGEIYALAGGTLNHGLLCGNSYTEIRRALENKKADCIPFTSEVKLHIQTISDGNSYVYPDAMVICGEIEKAEKDKNSVTNPILIVEVLSKSTAAYDRGDKFHLYRNIPTFKEYVLIEQNKYIVDVHYKPDNSHLWKITRYKGIEKTIKIESLDIEISMQTLYKNVNLNTKI